LFQDWHKLLLLYQSNYISQFAELKSSKHKIQKTKQNKKYLTKKKNRKGIITVIMRRRESIGNKKELVEHGCGEENNRKWISFDDGSHWRWGKRRRRGIRRNPRHCNGKNGGDSEIV
jgi:hypothetical protein